MFREIVSNLSLSPAAGTQLHHYRRQLHREHHLRRWSAALAVTVLALQGLILLSPPDRATAGSSNDLIKGGLDRHNPSASLLAAYSNPELHGLLDHYGVTRDDLGNLSAVNLQAATPGLKVVGRNPHSTSDTNISVGPETFYESSLQSWGNQVIPALVGQRSRDGHVFALLIGSGDLVTAPAGTVIQTDGEARAINALRPISALAPKALVAQVKPTPPPAPVGKPHLVRSESVKVLSPNGQSSSAQPLSPGSLITYTLTTANTGNGAAHNVVISQNLRDVLEYADLTQLNGAQLSDGILSWPKTDIPAGSTKVVSYQVEIKQPIPVQPVSATDPKSYDLRMDSVYGSLVSLQLASPVQKQLEAASARLPQTNTLYSALVAILLLIICAFLYIRSHQLVTEVGILHGDQPGSRSKA